MTVTKGDAAKVPHPAAPRVGDRERRTHVPADGTPAAAAVERARREMLDDARPRRRTRIGADVVCEALIRQGVDVFFGYPGGVVLPLYDVLGDYPELRHILVRHEQGGAHAADGYARVTGRVGVCLGTSGPGATNLVTGIATAQLDSIPLVAITGNVPGALLGKDAFQEIDINGITLPMTKHNYLVRNADDLPRVFAEAFHIARTGRPGPVHVDITKDALQQETSATHPTHDQVVAGLPGFKPNMDGNVRQLRLAAAEIARATRPVILAGHGVLHAEAWDELRALAEKAQIPVAHTLLGIGAMDETHPLSYGFMGMHGWKHVNRAIQSADLLVAVGMRFDDRVTGNVRTYAPYARIVHVDIDPAEIGKNVAVEVPIVGDAKRVLAGLLPLVDEVAPETRREYFAQLADWRRDSEGASWHGSGAWRDGLLSADFVVARIGELTDHDGTYVASQPRIGADVQALDGPSLELDHCFNALALAPGLPAEALDQFEMPFDHQDASGALPDVVGSYTASYVYVKPPVHGWALARRSRDLPPLDQGQTQTILDRLAALTGFWMRARRVPGSSNSVLLARERQRMGQLHGVHRRAPSGVAGPCRHARCPVADDDRPRRRSRRSTRPRMATAARRPDRSDSRTILGRTPRRRPHPPRR